MKTRLSILTSIFALVICFTFNDVSTNAGALQEGKAETAANSIPAPSLPLSISSGNWINYTNGNSIKAIATEGNFLWVGTTGGVVRWDLTSDDYIKYITADGLADNYVQSVAIDNTGDKWFGTRDGGVSKFDGTTWTTYTTDDGLMSNYVSAIAIDGAGNKWFGTLSGVSKFDGATWTTYTTADGLMDNNVVSIAIDNVGNKWFGTRSGGVSKFDGTTWTTYTTTDGLVNNTVWTIAIDSAGDKWFGTYGGVSKFDGTTWTSYTASNGLVQNWVWSIAIDNMGNKWFGTSGGVSKFDGTTWTKWTTLNGLSSNIVAANSIAIDGAGNKWFGTNSDGINKFDDMTWTTFVTVNEPADNQINAIAVDSTGDKWFGTYGGVSKLSEESWTTYTTADGLAHNYVYAIEVDSAGNKWFGTNGGVSKFDGTTWTTYTEADGLVNNYVSAIAIDSVGNKWFGTNGGVSKFDGTEWTSYTTADGLADNWVTSIAIDSAGNKWFGTHSDLEGAARVSKFDGTTWTSYYNADGLVGYWINATAIDGAGNIWFGTISGTSKFDGTTWTSYHVSDGSNGEIVYAIAVDSANNKWFGTSSGASKFDESTLTVYTISDGLADSSVTAVTIDNAGNKWFGTSSGVSVLLGSETSTAYSISGQVTDTNNNPIVGVNISATGNNSTFTDGNGYYTITDLVPGNYSLLANKDGYAFLPGLRTVTLPPNANGIDFTGIPNDTDTDGDGLLDAWELNGYDQNNDGKIDIDLPAMGADPNRKDIFVEVDWMSDSNHSHRPSPIAIRRIVNAFANSPVDNGVGINLHVDAGYDSIDYVTGQLWGELSGGNEIPHQDVLGQSQSLVDDLNNIILNNFATARNRVFHYSIFAHKWAEDGVSTCSSGFSLGNGYQYFVVALGCFKNEVGSIDQQAGTFMHELGHNLGLAHGGDDDVNYKPNYLSIMNYSFQMNGLIINGIGGHYDYSRFDLPALNESLLSEKNGLNGGPEVNNYGTKFHISSPFLCIPASLNNLAFTITEHANGPVNWDCGLGIDQSPVQEDVNNDGIISTLNSHNDWANLDYTAGGIGSEGVPSPLLVTSEALQQIPEEITPEIDELIQHAFSNALFLPAILDSSE
ncbi:MAG: carboxypeptidase regulatory-like domain-containing protein [Anaerolineae bacterium]|nr:carboxypeptidase regulatory-like domain-containing protein [Anaerolineae bacterium]